MLLTPTTTGPCHEPRALLSTLQDQREFSRLCDLAELVCLSCPMTPQHAVTTRGAPEPPRFAVVSFA
jgi:hypothetical protein